MSCRLAECAEAEALALQDLGVTGPVAIAKRRSRSLAIAGDERRLPISDSSVEVVFTGRHRLGLRRPLPRFVKALVRPRR
ncbi:hypothetical protein ZWY2020_033834 [Hordeum vulgare]|nr:hypothetical protein ZWY2020_033834 [Hordeum vulgare]